MLIILLLKKIKIFSPPLLCSNKHFSTSLLPLQPPPRYPKSHTLRIFEVFEVWNEWGGKPGGGGRQDRDRKAIISFPPNTILYTFSRHNHITPSPGTFLREGSVTSSPGAEEAREIEIDKKK